MSKVVFLDVDGTLIDEFQQVTPSAIGACAQAMANGHTLFFCTGRSKPEIYPDLWSLNLSGFIGGGGAYAELAGRVLLDITLPRSDIADVSTWLSEREGEWLWASPNSLNASPGFMAAFMGEADPGAAAGGDWQAYAAQVRPYLHEGVPQSASKCTFMFRSTSAVTLDQVQAAFDDRFTIIPGSVDSGAGLIGELIPKGVNKAEAMHAVIGVLGVDVSDTIAVGDSTNDVEILRAAGVGVAMGNATSPAMDAADWVTDRIDEDGVARAFAKLGLI